jgi:CubicO group peptidase (beta-lactamase class C family)
MNSAHATQPGSTIRLVTATLMFCSSFAPYPSQTFGQQSPAPAAAPLSQLEGKVVEYMAARARVTGFSGAVLVAREGQVVFRGAFGDANRELSVVNSPETKFRIGSVSKQFTAAAVLLLAQRGALQFTDPIHKHLPEWPPAWSKVTIHHLLSHTAGLPRLTTRAMLDVSALSAATPIPFRTVRDLFAPGEELQPLDSEPGERWAYSNVGYIVLGMLVAKVSGQSFCAFMSQAVFQPLDMAESGCEVPSVIVKNRASGYNRVEGVLTNAPYVDVGFTGGAGAFYSTVDDLLRWDRALSANTLLDAAWTAKLFTAVMNEYGYGWWVQTKFNRRVEWHGGNAPGLVSQITRYPKERLFIGVLSNVWSASDRSQVRAMSNELAALMLGEPCELPRRREQRALAPAAYDAYVGEYRGKDVFAIAREGDRLVVQVPPGNTVFEIVPESETQFFWKDREYYLTFERNPTGEVTGVSIRNEGELARWTRVAKPPRHDTTKGR